MPKPSPRTLTLTIGLALAVIVAAWEFTALRSVDADRPLPTLESPPVPWGGLAGREAARALESRWRVGSGEASGPVLAQLGHYPLSPWNWLLQARIDWYNDRDVAELRRNLAAAISTQPDNRELRWQAANLAQSTGDADLVLDQLAQWLADAPRSTAQALFLAARWADDPGTRLDRVVPDDDEFLTQAMHYAMRSNNVPLAQAVWQRLDHPRAPADPAFAAYITTALNNNRPDLAMAAWQQVDPHYTPGDIPVGDFSVPLEAMPTFGWNVRVPAGATVERVLVKDNLSSRPPSRDLPTEGAHVDKAPDQVRGDKPREDVSNERTKQRKNETTRQAQALRLSFNGEENLHLATPDVRFPMPEPGTYHLTGWWRAEGLTTRSLPYVQLYAESPEHPFNQTIGVPGQAFEWQRFEIPFEVTEAGEIFRFRLRRNRTDAFDRYIAGEIWLAGLGVVGDERVVREEFD